MMYHDGAPWENEKEFFDAKEKILSLLISKKVSLMEIEWLFSEIVYDVERCNPITINTCDM